MGRKHHDLTECEVADVERRLRLYRQNAPKVIAAELGVHKDTINRIGLGLHAVQMRRQLRRNVTVLEVSHG